MISRSDALHHLWTGVARLPRREETRAFDAALDALCPARRQLVELACPAGGGRVLLDDTEVMPMVSLGDVVAEEFDLTLPYGTLLLFVPREELVDDAPAERRAAALGRACGQIVSETVHRGAFPLDREARIAGALAAACLARAGAVPLGGARARAAFERALARAVRDVTDGTGLAAGLAADRPRDGAAEGLADDLSACLGRRGADGEAPSFDDWLEAVHAATCGARGASGERAAACLSPFVSVPPSLPGPGPRGDE